LVKLERPLSMTLWGKLAFAVVVLQGLAQALFGALSSLAVPQKTVLVVCAGVYTALACWDGARERMGTGKYLLLQNALGLALPWLGSGHTAMSGLAVVSQSGLVLAGAGMLVPAALHTLNVLIACSVTLPAPFAAMMAYTFVVAVVFVMAFTQAVASELRTREKLDAASRELASYAAEAENLATMKERTRIARELHDSLGHTLTTTHVHLLVAERELTEVSERTRGALKTAQRVVRAGLDDLRRTVRALDAPVLENRSMEVALGLLVSDHDTDSLAAHFVVEGEPRSLPPVVALALYRVTQEALTNVVKHAQADRVEVNLSYGEREVRLLVRDNGIGMLGTREEKFGLQGIRERARVLGGSLDLRGSPGLTLEWKAPS
jgi:signal transduction histidine kinase